LIENQTTSGSEPVSIEIKRPPATGVDIFHSLLERIATLESEVAQLKAVAHAEHTWSISNEAVQQIIERCIAEHRRRLGTHVTLPAE
jgi:hypothetical protein